ncbi:MAG TPA: hypothetical protein VFV43_01895 [Limnobacter sp.]|nr:hypothetical protein [Limnobacter sp.]
MAILNIIPNTSTRGRIALLLGVLLLAACNPRMQLNEENLLTGARAETYVLNHGALCARLPSGEAIEAYANDSVPPNSAVARDVRAWDLSGLLDILKTQDGRWVILPSAGLKKLEGVHFRKDAKGENDALCFGRLWVENTVDYIKNKPFGLENAATARFQATLKDAHMLRHFKDLKVESFDPTVFVLNPGTVYAGNLSPNFVIEMALHPTPTGWFLAKSASAPSASKE